MATIYDLAKNTTAKTTPSTPSVSTASGGVNAKKTGLTTEQKAGIATAGTTAEKVAIATGKTTDANTPSVPPYQGGNSQTGGTNAAGVSNPSYVNAKSQRVFQYLENGALNPEYNASERDEKYTINNTPEQSSPVSNVSATETDFWQKQIDNANTRANAALAERDKIFKASMETLKKSEELQKAQYAALEAKIGAQNVPELKSIIGGIEGKTGSPVVISENFIASAEKISAQFANDPEKRKRFLTELAENSLLKNKSPQEQAEWNAQTEVMGEGSNTLGDTALGNNDEGTDALVDATSVAFGIGPAVDDALVREIMNDPKATGAEIMLAKITQAQINTNNANAQKLQSFLQEQAEEAKKSEEKWTALFSSQASETKKMLSLQASIDIKREEIKKEKIYSEKAETISQMNKKAAKLEGFNRALLGHLGLSGGTYEMNALAESATKMQALINQTANEYDLKIDEIDLNISEINSNLTANLLQISQSLSQNILSAAESTRKEVSGYSLSSLQNANETDSANAKMMGDFFSGIIESRSKAEESARKALQEAREATQKEAERISDALGFLYIVDEKGEIAVMTDDEGNPLATFDREKEDFDQWSAKVTKEMEKARLNNTLSNTAFDNNMAMMKEMRAQEEYIQKRSQTYSKEGIPRWEQFDMYSRTDRHNNPTATYYSDTAAKNLAAVGLVEGEDFWVGDSSGKYNTIAFADIDTGVYGTAALLASGQVASWYGNDKYSGKGNFISVLERVAKQDGVLSGKTSLPLNASADGLQTLFNKLGSDGKAAVVQGIYRFEAGKDMSQGEFSPMRADGGVEEEVPVWENLAINRFASRYNSSKEDISEIKKYWNKEKKSGVDLDSFLGKLKAAISGSGSASAHASSSSSSVPASAGADGESSFFGF